MGLDKALTSYENYKEFKTEVDDYLSQNLDSKFELFDPLLVPLVRQKHDYITIKPKNYIINDDKTSKSSSD